jgi:hypothetical protein
MPWVRAVLALAGVLLRSGRPYTIDSIERIEDKQLFSLFEHKLAKQFSVGCFNGVNRLTFHYRGDVDFGVESLDKEMLRPPPTATRIAVKYGQANYLFESLEDCIDMLCPPATTTPGGQQCVYLCHTALGLCFNLRAAMRDQSLLSSSEVEWPLDYKAPTVMGLTHTSVQGKPPMVRGKVYGVYGAGSIFPAYRIVFRKPVRRATTVAAPH